ncbi:ornithine cyclodeaminase family protein [Marinomonas sp. 15G1-11]|uniref:Ornithine cyclodeaminase family protein n=1 Tax=Marinomonas phaeophyticola TaxID=3004091 RepID=A0ABT4JRR7_9GAMM|nr:ornithine cyclodeaminase family protein [Marinomonas sp. 15G1-11]MCZ2720284.1 ornithine cyclodeaminase family protein [Marinomonas sp. 15G1-11]
MRIVTLKEIQSMVSLSAATVAVRDAFIDYSQGLIEQPDPMQILFKDELGRLTGDCHVKSAQKKRHAYFVIKVASGFYNNAAAGLPVNNGLVLVMSSDNGQAVALLQDEGWLTQVRTAAAGALAASLRDVKKTDCLGVIGTGIQAYLQVKMITEKLSLKRVAVLGRSLEKSAAFCRKLNEELDVIAVPMDSARSVCHASQVVITVTPSERALIRAEDLPESLHIVAIGADSPGKLEIDPSVFHAAKIVVTDDHDQCLHHGDFGAAVRAKAIKEDADYAMGKVLSGQYSELDFNGTGISIVDLTGLGAQDLAVASLLVDQFSTSL